MKKAFNVLMIVCAFLIALSCSNSKTYTDRLNDQRDAINRLLDDSSFTVIRDYPANGVFGEKEFYRLPNDVYMNVIDSGNGTRAVVNSTTVLARYSAVRIMTDTIFVSNYGSNSNGTYPIEFKYPNPSGSAPINDRDHNYLITFGSSGMLSALEYVGDGATVRLIVPFTVGSTNDLRTYQPVFFDHVQFRFAK